MLLAALVGPGSPVIGWSGSVQAHAATPLSGSPWKPDAGKPNHFNPDAVTTKTPAAVPAVRPTPGAAAAHASLQPIARGGGAATQAALVALSASSGAHFLSGDGALELSAPAGAVSAADLSAANGQKLALRVIQTAVGSGSNAGGSGHVSLGSYLLQVVDGAGYLAPHGLRKPLQVTLHIGGRDDALNLTDVTATINGGLPRGVSVAVAPVSNGKPTATTTSAGAIAGLGKLSTAPATFDRKAQTLTVSLAADSPSTTITWNTFAPVATFGSPDPFNTDLNAGALTTSIPLETPAGPGGLAPPLALTYSSESVAEQHSPQGVDGWVGQGWNLALGSITWAEHQGTSGCGVGGPTCPAVWEDSWQLSDPYGTAADLIPPNINVATYYDDTGNPISTGPVQWHTAPESRALIYSFQSGLSLPDGTVAPPCFRVFLPSGIMEEFGCTADALEYYFSSSDGKDYVYAWNLDLITDQQGNQIHVTYQQDVESKDFTGYSTHSYIRDAELQDVEWDSPTCQNAQSACPTTGTAPNLWQPRLRVSFDATHVPTRLSNAPANCNTGANLRCDDPGDAGEPGPLVMSDSALNDARLQASPQGDGTWNDLKDYQFTYSEDGPTQISDDPVTGQTESVAGDLLLTQVVEAGEDQSTSLPPLTFSYANQTSYYEDSQFPPNPATTCGPTWNTGNGLSTSTTHPNAGCALWGQSYATNSYYLASFDNGMGFNETYTWKLARNNTHGVNSGAGADPFTCDDLVASAQAAYPCDLADDENWSHIVLLTRKDSTVDAQNQPISGTTQYRYALSGNGLILGWAYECGDCDQSMYWGNVDDWDTLDYYNATFMGFAQTTVTNPDGSYETHLYHATAGYGVYDRNEIVSLKMCKTSLQPDSTCWSDPWSETTNGDLNPVNAAHGHEIEVDSYDTDSALLSKTTTLYQATCPPAGVAGSPAVTGWGDWKGNLVAELDHGNPMMACEIEPSQIDTYTYDGASSGPHISTTYAYTTDPTTGLLASTTTTTTVNGGANGSPTTVEHTTWNVWRDTVTASSTGATGVYLANLPTYAITSGSDGVPTACQQTLYPGSSGSGAQSGMTSAEVIAQASYTTTCGYAGNNWSLVGPLKTTTTYDTAGNALGTVDPDANAGVAGHTGCTAGGVASSACTAYDSIYDALPASQSNALNQTASTSYSAVAGGGFGLWPTSVTDANGQTTSSTYDVLGRVTSVAQPGDASGAVRADASTLLPALPGSAPASGVGNCCGVTFSNGEGLAINATAVGQNASFSFSVPTAGTYDLSEAVVLAPGHGVASLAIDGQTIGQLVDGYGATVSIAAPVSPGQVTLSAGAHQLTWTITGANPAASGYSYGVNTVDLTLRTTVNWTYTDWCAATGAQAPCVEVDQTQRLDASGDTVTQRAFYDGLGRLVETRTPAPGGQDVVVYHVYDTMGRDIFDTNPYFVTAYTGAPGVAAFVVGDGTQAGTLTKYLSQRQTQVQDALSHTTTTTQSAQCGFGSDSGCYSVSTTLDPEGHQQQTLTDGLGRVAYTLTYMGTSSPYTLYAQTTSGYDLNGDLVKVTRPDGALITDQYDLAGRQTGMTDPDRGSESYSEDANGNLTETVDARGARGTTWAGYDGLNRPLWRNTTNSASGAYVTYSYDSTASGNDGVGRLTGETFSNANAGGTLSGSYATTYDARGQVASSTETLEGTPYTTAASYNDAGEVTSQTYPDGDVLTTSYDPSSGWQTGLSLQLSGASSATPLLASETYAGNAGGAWGQPTHATLGAFNLGPNTTVTYQASYDALGRPTSRAYAVGGSPSAAYFSVQPTYDALSNVIELYTQVGLSPQGTDTQVFCYDDLSRLTWAGSSGTPACSGAPTPGDTGSLAGTSASYSASYSYDAMNRLTSSPLGTYTYGDGSHADAATAIGSSSGSVWSASYDAAGEMTCRAASSSQTCAGSSPTGDGLSYDNEGRLVDWQEGEPLPSAPTTTALYDGAGNRVQSVRSCGNCIGPGVITSYLGGLEEVTTAGTTTTTTAYYGSLAESVNGTLSYLLSDGLGSVSLAVSASTAQTTAMQLYGPYGAVRYQSGTLPTDKGYTGQVADATTSGLDYYGARYYDPVAGQFTSADTTLAGGLNEYAYVAGNPESRTDPSGHHYTCPTGMCGPSAGGDPIVPTNPTNPTASSGGSGGTGQGGTKGINQGHPLAPVGGSPCDTVVACAGIQYPEHAPSSPCLSDTDVCYWGNDPQGLFQFLLTIEGQGAQGFTVVGQQGIKTFLSYLSEVQQKVDVQFKDILDDWNHAVVVLAGLGALAGAATTWETGPGVFVGIGVGATAGGLVLQGEISEINHIQARIDGMIISVENRLQDISHAMDLQKNGATTAVTIAAFVDSSDIPAPDDAFGSFQVATNPWEAESIHVTDVYTWGA